MLNYSIFLFIFFLTEKIEQMIPTNDSEMTGMKTEDTNLSQSCGKMISIYTLTTYL